MSPAGRAFTSVAPPRPPYLDSGSKRRDRSSTPRCFTDAASSSAMAEKRHKSPLKIKHELQSSEAKLRRMPLVEVRQADIKTDHGCEHDQSCRSVRWDSSLRDFVAEKGWQASAPAGADDLNTNPRSSRYRAHRHEFPPHDFRRYALEAPRQ